MTEVYIGLGSNLQSPIEQLRRAVRALHNLPSTKLVTVSPVYQTRAIGPPQPDYLNATAKLHTALAPQVLLDALQQLEQQQGRERTEHWGPRTLDLDILLYGDQRIDTERLTVPHPHLHERAFVLYPLHDIAPKLQLPCGATLATLKDHCDTSGIEKIAQALPLPEVSDG